MAVGVTFLILGSREGVIQIIAIVIAVYMIQTVLREAQTHHRGDKTPPDETD